VATGGGATQRQAQLSSPYRRGGAAQPLATAVDTVVNAAGVGSGAGAAAAAALAAADGASASEKAPGASAEDAASAEPTGSSTSSVSAPLGTETSMYLRAPREHHFMIAACHLCAPQSDITCTASSRPHHPTHTARYKSVQVLESRGEPRCCGNANAVRRCKVVARHAFAAHTDRGGGARTMAAARRQTSTAARQSRSRRAPPAARRPRAAPALARG